MQVNPYVHFNGNCEAAFRFYVKCLGAKIEAMMPFEGTPAAQHVPAEWKNKVLHASLSFGNDVLLGSDAPPGRYSAPQGFSVSINLKDVSEAERIFQELSANGKMTMPLQETFWAARFAMFTDQYGIPWTINCEKAA